MNRVSLLEKGYEAAASTSSTIKLILFILGLTLTAPLQDCRYTREFGWSLTTQRLEVKSRTRGFDRDGKKRLLQAIVPGRRGMK